MEDINAESTVPISPWLRLRASAVHLYTASGAVLTLLILVAAYNGDAVSALWFMLAALVIDSTDGLLARRFRVKELLPSFDGRRLDDIVFDLGSGTVGAILLFLSLLVFLPVRYIYPSRTFPYRKVTLAFTSIC